ncbi:hypothetical protein [Nitratireductor aquibiodomus]|uniref:hypothetical protein n=1 Tax=Nitratireductor aquibiodomus TaxID=204799 RepID=UPI00138DE1EB|nr:hypothetical protein [Nitratireductor aquibiodomus]
MERILFSSGLLTNWSGKKTLTPAPTLRHGQTFLNERRQLAGNQPGTVAMPRRRAFAGNLRRRFLLRPRSRGNEVALARSGAMTARCRHNARKRPHRAGVAPTFKPIIWSAFKRPSLLPVVVRPGQRETDARQSQSIVKSIVSMVKTSRDQQSSTQGETYCFQLQGNVGKEPPDCPQRPGQPGLNTRAAHRFTETPLRSICLFFRVYEDVR